MVAYVTKYTIANPHEYHMNNHGSFRKIRENETLPVAGEWGEMLQNACNTAMGMV